MLKTIIGEIPIELTKYIKTAKVGKDSFFPNEIKGSKIINHRNNPKKPYEDKIAK